MQSLHDNALYLDIIIITEPEYKTLRLISGPKQWPHATFDFDQSALLIAVIHGLWLVGSNGLCVK